MILISINMIISLMFTQMKHPLAMGLILLIQTTIMSTISGIMSKNFWFSYVLFLIFLGGMLVLFIYVTSLASNEMFNMSTNIMMIMLLLFPITMVMKNYWPELTMYNQESMNFLMNNNLSTMLTKLYNYPTNLITIMLASYLFLTLIIVIKMTNIFMGPLRKTY
uniref:NADH-ubiquinone oxidoreductase chain 6 n=1 Tax=Phyllodromica sp. Phil TaxID=2093477 RepID=A0A2P1H9N0_9NEOP|nr:NADH dehydrogenase subunit 6 [Phyllodromica sp. Phil]